MLGLLFNNHPVQGFNRFLQHQKTLAQRFVPHLEK
jgi:hypothetical protein